MNNNTKDIGEMVKEDNRMFDDINKKGDEVNKIA